MKAQLLVVQKGVPINQDMIIFVLVFLSVEVFVLGVFLWDHKILPRYSLFFSLFPALGRRNATKMKKTGSRKRGRGDSLSSPNTETSSTNHRRLLDLPHDLIKASLEFVPYSELFQARLVSKKWAGAVADCVECFLSGQGGRGSEWRGTLVDGKWIPRCGKQFRQALCVLPLMTDTFRESIHTVNLEKCQRLNSIDGLEKALPALKELSLPGTEVTHFKSLSSCKPLSVLILQHCECLVVADIRAMSLIPRLTELRLGDWKLKSVTPLWACPALRILDLSYCHRLTDAGIQGLERIPTLEELTLSYTKVSSVSHLSAARRCRS